ncbi:MAG: hypothetical protein AB1449_04020 [Chloroflexota bacterium]
MSRDRNRGEHMRAERVVSGAKAEAERRLSHDPDHFPIEQVADFHQIVPAGHG